MVAFTRQNSAEGGSNTTTVTAGNSGGTSGDPFDAITGALTFSTTQVNAGSLSYKCTAAAAAVFPRWTFAAPASGSDLYARLYVYFDTSVTALTALGGFYTTAGAALSTVQVSSSGSHWLAAVSGGTSGTGTTTIAANTWYRVELHTTLVTSLAQTTVRVYNAAGTLLETITSTANGADNTGTAQARFGVVGTVTQTLYMDNLAVYDQTWIGAGALPDATVQGPAPVNTAVAAPVGSVFAFPYSNTAEGGTDATTVTAGNSGGVSGRAIDIVSSTPTFSATQKNEGTLSYRFAGSTKYLQWALAAPSDLYTRQYVYFDTAISASMLLASLTGTHTASLQVSSAGSHWASNVTTAGLTTGTTTIAANTWYRVETHTIFSSTAGQMIIRVYDASGTLLETITGGSNGNTAGISAIRFGAQTTGAGTIYLDDLAVNDAGWLGPYLPPGTVSADEVDTSAVAYDASATSSGNGPADEVDTQALAYDTTIGLGAAVTTGETDTQAAALDATVSLAVTIPAGETDTQAVAYDASVTSSGNGPADEVDTSAAAPNALTTSSGNAAAGETDTQASAYDAVVGTQSGINAGDTDTQGSALGATVTASGNAAAGETDTQAVSADASATSSGNAAAGRTDTQAAAADAAISAATGVPADEADTPAAAADASVTASGNALAGETDTQATAYDASATSSGNASAGRADALAAAADALITASGKAAAGEVDTQAAAFDGVVSTLNSVLADEADTQVAAYDAVISASSQVSPSTAEVLALSDNSSVAYDKFVPADLQDSAAAAYDTTVIATHIALAGRTDTQAAAFDALITASAQVFPSTADVLTLPDNSSVEYEKLVNATLADVTATMLASAVGVVCTADLAAALALVMETYVPLQHKKGISFAGISTPYSVASVATQKARYMSESAVGEVSVTTNTVR